MKSCKDFFLFSALVAILFCQEEPQAILIKEHNKMIPVK